LFGYITKTSFVVALFRRNASPHSLLILEPQPRGVNKRKGEQMRITRNRAIAAATAAAIALTAVAVTPASARPYRHHHRGAGNAAVLGAVAGLFGTIATLAARDRYERHYGYGYAPYYAPPPPAPYGYYGPGPYYRY
jgi:hypothetical protein